MAEKIQESQINLRVTADLEATAKSSVGADLAAEAELKHHIIPDQIEIPGFSELQLIAKGASGSVYSAVRDVDEMLVALKVYNKELTPNPESTLRFQHEVATLKRLSHPSIVRILGAGHTDSGQSYIFMECATGESLRSILDASGALEPQRAVAITREVCRALEVAHSEGIIHRDLKPGNIIVDHNDIAKVVDFGIAKALGSSADTITQYGAIIGTPAYMSPEQCKGQSVDSRSDIYSLGCTLFELLTNRKAFESDTTISTLAKQLNQDRSFLKPILDASSVEPDLQRIVLKCLEREPAKRYPSIEALDYDLSAFKLDIPKTAPTPKPASSRPYIIGASLVLASIVLFAAFCATPKEKSVDKPAAAVPVMGTIAGGGKRIDIKDRFRGTTIFCEEAPDLTFTRVLADARRRGVPMRNADLRGANLTDADLSTLDLRNADLSGAKLIRATMERTLLDSAVLVRADLTDSKLDNSSFFNADLRGAKLRGASARGANFSGADFTFSDLMHAELLNCDLSSVDMTGAKIANLNLLGSAVKDANIPQQPSSTGKEKHHGKTDVHR
ncbi:MAG TPA: serine/threonine-protein kinase [Drouetiella sp.]